MRVIVASLFATFFSAHAEFYCPPNYCLQVAPAHEEQATPTPIFVYYNAAQTDHEYTVRSTSWDSGWLSQGVAFYAYSSQAIGTSPIYEYYNTAHTDHEYTLRSTPWDSGWQSQGVAFYAYSSQTIGTSPIYEYYNAADQDHEYTLRSTPLDSGWQPGGAVFYAFQAQPWPHTSGNCFASVLDSFSTLAAAKCACVGNANCDAVYDPEDGSGAIQTRSRCCESWCSEAPTCTDSTKQWMDYCNVGQGGTSYKKTSSSYCPNEGLSSAPAFQYACEPMKLYRCDSENSPDCECQGKVRYGNYASEDSPELQPAVWTYPVCVDGTISCKDESSIAWRGPVRSEFWGPKICTCEPNDVGNTTVMAIHAVDSMPLVPDGWVQSTTCTTTAEDSIKADDWYTGSGSCVDVCGVLGLACTDEELAAHQDDAVESEVRKAGICGNRNRLCYCHQAPELICTTTSTTAEDITSTSVAQSTTTQAPTTQAMATQSATGQATTLQATTSAQENSMSSTTIPTNTGAIALVKGAFSVTMEDASVILGSDSTKSYFEIGMAEAMAASIELNPSDVSVTATGASSRRLAQRRRLDTILNVAFTLTTQPSLVNDVLARALGMSAEVLKNLALSVVRSIPSDECSQCASVDIISVTITQAPAIQGLQVAGNSTVALTSAGDDDESAAEGVVLTVMGAILAIVVCLLCSFLLRIWLRLRKAYRYG